MFGHGSIWLSESIVYGHAAMFMLAVGLDARRRRPRAGGRVLCRRLAAHGKALVDLCGSVLLLLPFMAVLAWFAWPYVARSWAIFEASRETSGIPAVFLLKTLIPAFALLMALQGVSQAIKAANLLRGARHKGEP